MKWFDKWIMKKAENIMRKERDIDSGHVTYNLASAKQHGIRPVEVSDSLDTRAVKFKMYKASGGTIIETAMYDDRKDRHNVSLYVVTNDKNLGEEIGKIITMESLKV